MSKLIPIILAAVGILGGGAAGYMLRPAPVPESVDELQSETSENEKGGSASSDTTTAELAFVKLNNQFVVPVVSDENVAALVVLSITLETDASSTDQLYNLEPKIRDVLLRVLFDHAYGGGFDGQFTAPLKLDRLRKALIEGISPVTDGVVSDVLITDIVRQDT